MLGEKEVYILVDEKVFVDEDVYKSSVILYLNDVFDDSMDCLVIFFGFFIKYR